MFHQQRSNIRICLGPGLWLSANVTELRDFWTIISHLKGAVLLLLQLNRWSPVDRQTNLGPAMVPNKLGREDLPCPGHLVPNLENPQVLLLPQLGDFSCLHGWCDPVAVTTSPLTAAAETF